MSTPEPDENLATERPEPAGGPRRVELAGLIVCAMLAVTWSWWAWQQGAWFGVVLLPGGIVLCMALVLLAGFAPRGVSLRPSGLAGVVLVALVALGAWTALSALWSPAPAAAVADAQQVLIYAAAFGLGLWMADLLGSRSELALVPLAVAGAVAGGLVAIGLAGDQPNDYLLADGTLGYPIDYRNANAAFFLIAAFPALGLAAAPQLDWRARGAALGVTTLCIDCALLSQSRGSIPAAAIALAVYVLAAPLRVRAVAWLGLAVVCSLGLLPALSDLYTSANDEGLSTVVDEMNAAGVAIVLTVVAAAALGAVAAHLDGRVPLFGSSAPKGNRVVVAGLVALVIGGVAVFSARVGDPVDWVSNRAEEFSRGGTPDLSEGATRFQASLASNRRDVWRVALDEVEAEPLVGSGGGSYQYAYTREREVVRQNARDAHSIELEVLAELGAVGAVLLLIAQGTATVAMLRARRLDPAAAGLAAIAMATGAYWLAHSSVDWFVHFGGLTTPVMALLGSACAAGARSTRAPGRGVRLWVIAAALVLAVSLVPPFLSERYVNDAYAGWRADLDRAYDDLDRAASLNRLSDTPLLAEGAIAQAAGDRDRAIEALLEAEDRVPDEWATHYLLAELYAQERPELAREQLATARRLNPLSEEVVRLERALDDAAAVRRIARKRAEGRPQS